MINRAWIAYVAFCVASAPLAAQQAPAVGAPAPELALEELLQAPPGAAATLERLRGKVVVLEFWATWCGPCVGVGREHLNELAHALRDEPVQFIAITDQKKPLIARFLEKFPMNAWVGLDLDGSTLRDYGVRARPATFVIDRDGKLVARTYPTYLEAKHVREVLAGKPTTVRPFEGSGEAKDAATAAVDAPKDRLTEFWARTDRLALPLPAFEIVIHPLPEWRGGRSHGHTANWSAGIGVRLRRALAIVAEVRVEQVDGPKALLERRLAFKARCPDGTKPTVVRDAFFRAAERVYGVRIAVEKRSIPVYVLRKTTDTDAKLVAAVERTGSTNATRGRVVALGAPWFALRNIIAGELKRNIIDETGIAATAYFDYELTWDPETPGAFIAAVREQLGLELKEEQRAMDVVVVR